MKFIDPNNVFCHNPDCPAIRKLGLKNIAVHSRKQKRYICHICGKTFTETKGTMFYRLKYSDELVSLIITLIAFGCPIIAIVKAFGIDEQTITDWTNRADKHCQLNIVNNFTNIWFNNLVIWDKSKQMRYLSNIKSV